MSEPINAGDAVTVVDAVGETHRMEALSGVEPGDKFPIVWVRRPGVDERIPWPVGAVNVEVEQS